MGPPVLPATTVASGLLTVGHTWAGDAVDATEVVTFAIGLDDTHLRISFDAPYHGDPSPPGPPGPTDGLWEYEVVELFLLGADRQYVELEFGPAGHYLALRLRGVRTVVSPVPTLIYRSALVEGRWRGEASLPVPELPAGLRACNAHAIHGTGRARRYLAAGPAPGPKPDFHRLDRFLPLPWA